ncbi:cytosolic thiouridylase subunit 2 [Anticarsia gemmatalis]|uniref:cytosolic thiouridylase subunit 2 n=1 Tax=Anticarsia gemmatalis TaxID=129554 RepID=UPI003F76083F
MSCKKCNSPKSVILRMKDYYCDNCFMINTNHKFRACLGKNKVLSPNENVLICLSGGVGSSVLVDLIHYSISLDNTKKLRIVPFFLHIFDDTTIAESVLEQCKHLNFNIHMVHISDYMNSTHRTLAVNCIPRAEQDVEKTFQNMLNSMPPTAVNDFIIKIKRHLYIKYAEHLQCNTIFTAETTNTLAINLLSNLAIGRGSQVQNDIGFSDIRDSKVKILRPMKDITKEELDYYVSIRQLQPTSTNNSANDNSLQSVISSFVHGLQENFQSTISTVCKTADKIGNCNEDKSEQKCIICESNLNTDITKMSALEATNVSRTVSYGTTNFSQTTEISTIFDCDNRTAVFPFVHKYLCYGCSRNHSEMIKPSLPQHLQNIIGNS